MKLQDTQVLNLLMLNAIRSAIVADPVSAAFRFALSPGLAAPIERMTLAEQLALVGALPHCSLFVPRADLERVLATPLALLPLFTAAAPVVPSACAGENRRRVSTDRRHDRR